MHPRCCKLVHAIQLHVRRNSISFWCENDSEVLTGNLGLQASHAVYWHVLAAGRRGLGVNAAISNHERRESPVQSSLLLLFLLVFLIVAAQPY